MKTFQINLYLLLLALLFLVSCKLGKEYQRPDVVLQSSFAADSARAAGDAPATTLNGSAASSLTSFADTSSIADLPWAQFFSDTTLRALITKGITYNHDLLIALNRLDISARQLSQAKLLNLPSLNLAVSGQISRPSDNSLNRLSTQSFLQKSHVENYQVAASVAWEADIWGKIRGRKEIALRSYLQTREAVKAVQTSLVTEIAQGFYNLVMLDKQLKIAQQNLALNDSFLQATKLLKDAGNVTLLAVQQAQSQKQTTAVLIPALQQDIAIQENALQLLTGQIPGGILRNTTLTDLTIPGTLPTGLPLSMVSRRPDVRSDELALMIANTNVGISQANMYPTLNITAGGGLESFKSSNWFNIPGSLFGLAAGTVLQPIFNKRELRTKYEVAKLEREQAVIRFRQTVLVAGTEVADALVQTDKLQEQQVLAIQQTETLQQAVNNAQSLFRSDMANYLEVITAQGNALQAELNLAFIQRSRLNAMVELYRALGGGWQ